MCCAGNINAYFDPTLNHVGRFISKKNSIIALKPWTDTDGSASGRSTFITLSLQLTDVAAWVFSNIISDCVLTKAIFSPNSCDAHSRLVYLLDECGYYVKSPSYFLRTISIDTMKESSCFNSYRTYDKGKLLLSDSYVT